MNEIMYFLFGYGLPIIIALAAALMFVSAIGMGIANSRLLVLLFAIVIFGFVNPSYGLTEAPVFNIYAKGGKTFVMPFLQYGFYAMCLSVWIGNAFERRTPLGDAGGKWLVAFWGLLLAHLVAGMVIEDLTFFHILSPRGFLYALHIGMMAYAVASVIREEKHLNYVKWLILGLVLSRGIYALVRYAAFGGDPQNAYANLEGGTVGLKITFWDANEGILACMAAFYAAWQLRTRWVGKFDRATLFYIAMLAIELLVVVLSFRRSNWVAMILVACYFLRFLRPSRRVVVGVLGVILFIPAIWIGANKRFEGSTLDRNRSFLEVLAPDAKGVSGLDRRKSRFYELERAWSTLAGNPVSVLTGVGSWGSFDPGRDALALAYHEGRYDFVHSGFGHILLKSGLIGLVIFLGFGIAAIRRATVAEHALSPSTAALHFTFRAGLVAMIPTLVSGTPIPELRTTWMLGILIGMPLAIQAMTKSGPPASASEKVAARSHPNRSWSLA